MANDISLQIATETPERAPRERALLAFIGGATVTEAARKAGVSRQTASQWLNQDPRFQAKLQNAHAELRAAVMRRTENGLVEAVDAARGLLEHEDWKARAAGIRLLFGILRQLPKPRPTTPEKLARESAKNDRQAEFDWVEVIELRNNSIFEKYGGLPLREAP